MKDIQFFKLKSRCIAMGSAQLLIAILIFGTSCAGTVSRESHPAAPSCISCVECDEARQVNGYCELCQHGHVAGWEIRSREFHEALDAHGHEIDPTQILCLECAEVIEQDQFCRRCRMGYVDGQLYFTELTWSLHRGETLRFEEVECADCRLSHGGMGVCAECGTRWAGNVSFLDPDLHQTAILQLRRLHLALERGVDCETCSIAGFFGRPCPRCGEAPIPWKLPSVSVNRSVNQSGE